MIYSIGADIVEVERISELMKAHGDAFLRRVFTEREIAYCNRQKRPAEHFAARFAAKEALMKALHLGIGAGARFREVEVTRTERGAPTLLVLGETRELIESRGITRLHLSLSHTKGNALAFVVAECEPQE